MPPRTHGGIWHFGLSNRSSKLGSRTSLSLSNLHRGILVQTRPYISPAGILAHVYSQRTLEYHFQRRTGWQAYFLSSRRQHLNQANPGADATTDARALESSSAQAPNG